MGSSPTDLIDADTAATLCGLPLRRFLKLSRSECFPAECRVLSSSGNEYFHRDVLYSWLGVESVLPAECLCDVCHQPVLTAVVLDPPLGQWKLLCGNCHKKATNPGYIYAVQGREASFYKLGRAKDIHKRLQPLRTFDRTSDYRVIHSFPCLNYIAGEQFVHRLFGERRRKGEWFRLNSSDLEKLVAIKEYTRENEDGEPSLVWKSLRDGFSGRETVWLCKEGMVNTMTLNRSGGIWYGIVISGDTRRTYYLGTGGVGETINQAEQIVKELASCSSPLTASRKEA